MLSEPYSVYTYRYFLLKFGDCCWFGFKRNEHGNEGTGDEKVEPGNDKEETESYSCVACCICKIDTSYEIVKGPPPTPTTSTSSETQKKPGLAGALAQIKLDRDAAAAQEDCEVEVKTGYIGMLSTSPPSAVSTSPTVSSPSP
ncbi:hypothetical protein TL16_g08907 [Triparma laevis f. inornata]|uniref:Uncharacterized protein n=1 Tax=Triparma laevis f. inornata TaxID=1714386 RepID=A0A9W7B7N9_9STRA|nr:hypothetical protein TL16_g08907 [Triparma laevis f. inornata]